MRQSLTFLFIVAYAAIGNLLALRAFRHRMDPNAPLQGYQIWHSRYFTPAGQAPRRLAVRFVAWGGFALGLALWLLWR